MNILVGTLLLWAGAAWLWHKLPDTGARRRALEGAVALARFTLPRLTVALIGAALFAELLPADRIESLFGAQAGLRGLLLATLVAPFTPGGAFVAFAIGAAGLRVGATEAAVMAYVCSWGLFSLTRSLAYETPILGGRLVLRRYAVSLPLPFLVAVAAWLVA